MQSVTSISRPGEAASWLIMGSGIGDKTSINTLGLLMTEAFDPKRGRLMKIHTDGRQPSQGVAISTSFN